MLLSSKLKRNFSNKAYVFGSSINGALGKESFDSVTGVAEKLFPNQNDDINLNVKAIAAGWGHSAVITNDNQLALFGRPIDFENTLRYIYRDSKIDLL